jgi:hypothetical protein
MWRRLVILTLALVSLYLSAATGIQAKGPPASVPGLGICQAPTLGWPTEECEVGVRARRLTADKAGVGVGQTRVETVEIGPFVWCTPPCPPDGGPICPFGCAFLQYRVRVSMASDGLVYTWLMDPGAHGGVILERVDSTA